MKKIKKEKLKRKKIGKAGKKKSTAAPKPRNVWKINPKTRVKEGDEAYERARQKVQEQREIDGLIDFFGEK